MFQNLFFGLAIVCGIIAGFAALMVFTNLSGDPDWEWLFKVIYTLVVTVPIALVALVFWMIGRAIKWWSQPKAG